MKIERTFSVEKETKGAIRYQEDTDGQPPVIGTLYVRKWGLKGMPNKLRMTLTDEAGSNVVAAPAAAPKPPGMEDTQAPKATGRKGKGKGKGVEVPEKLMGVEVRREAA